MGVRLNDVKANNYLFLHDIFHHIHCNASVLSFIAL